MQIELLVAYPFKLQTLLILKKNLEIVIDLLEVKIAFEIQNLVVVLLDMNYEYKLLLQFLEAQNTQVVHDPYLDMYVNMRYIEAVLQFIHYTLYQKIIYDLGMYIVFDQCLFLYKRKA